MSIKKDLVYASLIYSNASDGNGTTVEIVDEAIRKDISVFALTDHQACHTGTVL